MVAAADFREGNIGDVVPSGHSTNRFGPDLAVELRSGGRHHGCPPRGGADSNRKDYYGFRLMARTKRPHRQELLVGHG